MLIMIWKILVQFLHCCELKDILLSSLGFILRLASAAAPHPDLSLCWSSEMAHNAIFRGNSAQISTLYLYQYTSLFVSSGVLSSCCNLQRHFWPRFEISSLRCLRCAACTLCCPACASCVESWYLVCWINSAECRPKWNCVRLPWLIHNIPAHIWMTAA